MTDTWVVIAGALQDGIDLYGPFDSEDEASLWALEAEDQIGQWEVVRVLTPEIP